MKQRIVAVSTGTVAVVAIALVGITLWRSQQMTKFHVLAAPLLIAAPEASKTMHLLPKGTTLYFDKSYPEGFTRYRVYVNIDRMPLPLKDLADPTEISPVEAYAPTKEDLQRLLREYPLTRDDLAAILKSGRLEKDEIRSLLREYSQ